MILPGTTISISLDKVDLTHKRYFDIIENYKKDKITELRPALLEVDKCLHESIKNRLVSSDLEVGAFLSGG